MKNYALPLALAGVVLLQACNQQPPAGAESAASTPAAEVSLDSPEKRLSYGIAYSLAQRISADNVPLDKDLFLQGASDALNGAPGRMTPEEIQAEMQTFQEKMMAERQATQDALSAANKEASEAFLTENATREGVTVTESGLQYEVLQAAQGAKPGADDTVEVHYRGTLVDGTEFDSSYSRGEPVTFGVGQVIPGWTEALQLMSVGSKYKLAIPSELAYGAGGAGQLIGPHSALIFEVELLSIPSQETAAEGGEEEAASAEG